MAWGKSRKPIGRATLLASRQAAAEFTKQAGKALEAGGKQAGKALKSTSREVARATAPARAAAARKISAPMSEAAAHRLRELLAVGLLGLTVFLFCACVSAWGEGNWCGRTGEAIAHGLLGSLGYASYVIVFCLAVWGISLFTRRAPETFSVRISGLVLCLVSFAALLAHFGSGAPANFPPGGAVGEFINHKLVETAGLGNGGTSIVLIVLTLITFALATDIAYYAALASGLRWVKERRTAVAGTMQPVPEAAPSKSVATRGRGTAAAPAKPKRGLLGRLLHRKDPSEDPAMLEPFEAVADEPGVGVGAASVAAPPRRRVEKALAGKPASEKAEKPAPKSPEAKSPEPRPGAEKSPEKPSPEKPEPKAEKPEKGEKPAKAEVAAEKPAEAVKDKPKAAAKPANKPIEGSGGRDTSSSCWKRYTSRCRQRWSPRPSPARSATPSRRAVRS